MSHFTPEREAEIHDAVSDWWDDLDWAGKVEILDPDGTGQYERLIDFGEWVNHEISHWAEMIKKTTLDEAAAGLRTHREQAYGRSRSTAAYLDDFLRDLAGTRGIFADKFDELELERRS